MSDNNRSSQPCELYISRIYGADEGGLVRIDARKGPLLLARIEARLENFAAALMGQGAVDAVLIAARLPSTPIGER